MESTKLITAIDEKEFNRELNAALEDFTSDDIRDIKFSTCGVFSEGDPGFGRVIIEYSALIIFNDGTID